MMGGSMMGGSMMPGSMMGGSMMPGSMMGGSMMGGSMMGGSTGPAPSPYRYRPAPSPYRYRPAPSPYRYRPAPSPYRYRPAPSPYRTTSSPSGSMMGGSMTGGSMMGGSMMGGSMMGGSMGPAPSPYRYRPAPSPSITQSDCATQCANTPCSDKSAGAGSHQILTCAQTCKMRILGETSVDCLGRCNRNGQSGCSLTVKGTTFGMCSASCTAGKSASQATSFINNDDCKRGCNVR
jgi:hypothetical protein